MNNFFVVGSQFLRELGGDVDDLPVDQRHEHGHFRDLIGRDVEIIRSQDDYVGELSRLD